MSEVYAGVNGHALTALRLVVGNVGPWVADCDFDGDADVSGAVTISIGSAGAVLELRGTVDPSAAGVEAGQRRVRIIAGGGAWGHQLEAKHYHNDARVKARTVAEDAARAVGESIGTFVPVAERIGADYVRQAGVASQVLEDVLGGAPWWVDYDGVTHAGPRASSEVDASAYEVLAYDPRCRSVTVAVNDPGAVRIGSVLSERLDAPRTVRELELTVGQGDLRIVAWCGGGEAEQGNLAGLMSSIIDRATGGRVWGKYRYRVLQMAGDRVDLEAVRSAAGLPNVLPVSMWPGLAGAHCELAAGAEVLVEFIEGDRTMPIVTHFAGKDGQGFVPVSMTLEADEVNLGGTGGAPVARQGDAVEVLLPPFVFSGTISGSPASGVMVSPLNKAIGSITGGSSKAKAVT